MRELTGDEVHRLPKARKLFAARMYQVPLTSSACVKAAIDRLLLPRIAAATPASFKRAAHEASDSPDWRGGSAAASAVFASSRLFRARSDFGSKTIARSNKPSASFQSPRSSSDQPRLLTGPPSPGASCDACS